jgi:hypothetical protein
MLAPKREDAALSRVGFTFVAVGTYITLLVAGTNALQESFRAPAVVTVV